LKVEESTKRNIKLGESKRRKTQNLPMPQEEEIQMLIDINL